MMMGVRRSGESSHCFIYAIIYLHSFIVGANISLRSHLCAGPVNTDKKSIELSQIAINLV